MKVPSQLDIHSDAFLRSLIRAQFRLSAGCAAVFLAGLFGLPLANYFLPELMAKRVFGFTLSWLILGVAFFPAVWVLSWVFIRRSMVLEETVVREVETGLKPGESGATREYQPVAKTGTGEATIPQPTR